MVESIGPILGRVLTRIKNQLMEQPFTPERSIQVDQIDELMDRWTDCNTRG